MIPTNRFAVVFYTVFGLAIIVIAYLGGGLANALRIGLATAAIFVAVRGVFHRSIPFLLIAAALTAWAVDAFVQQRILTYVGIPLFLGGFILLARTPRNATPHST